MSSPAPAPPDTAVAALAVEGLTVHLGGRRVLDRVSFRLRPGEFTGLIGSNGAGKTTLFRVILGLLRPTAGQVRIAGSARWPRVGGAVGYVPQRLALDPDLPLRARDLVALGVDGHRLGFPIRPGRRREMADRMLAAVGASGFADARVGRLSGGEQQRVLIAHALVSEPKLLLLDEPLANLDLRSGQEVVDVLHRITAERDVAVLLSSHDINPLLPVMDGLVYLAAGRAATGTPQQVVRADVLSTLYGHPVEVVHAGGRVVVLAGQGEALSDG